MPLVTVLTRDSAVERSVRQSLGGVHTVAVARSWDRLLWLVRERPVTVVVLDSAGLRREVTDQCVVRNNEREAPALE